MPNTNKSIESRHKLNYNDHKKKLKIPNNRDNYIQNYNFPNSNTNLSNTFNP